MIKVFVTKQSSFPVSTPKIKKYLADFLKSKGMTSESYVSVALIGKSRMVDLARKFLKEKNKLHNVLSFTSSEVKGKFYYPDKSAIDLGEIVVCYPVAFEEAKKEGKLIEDKVRELIEHAALHLMGVHHK